MFTRRPENPAEWRALIAYHDLKIYRLAPRVGLHPTRLSLALHGRAPIDGDLSERLARAIEDEASAA